MTESICGAQESRCVCVLPAAHEGPHECDPDQCGGSWTYDADGEFVAVRLPAMIPGTLANDHFRAVVRMVGSDLAPFVLGAPLQVKRGPITFFRPPNADAD